MENLMNNITELFTAVQGPLAPLANYKQFIVYKLVPSQTRPGKTDKFPVNHLTLEVENAHNPEIWTDVNTAIHAAKLYGEGYGVGFVFTVNDPFYFVDIDDCLEADNETWSPVANSLMTMLPGAAVEVSQSKRGLHIIGSGICPDHGCKNIPLGLELYTEARFAALTGTNAIGNAGVDSSTMLPNVVNQYFPSKGAVKGQEWTNEPTPEYNGTSDDNELLEKMLASGSGGVVFGGSVSFADLWTRNVPKLSERWEPDASDVNGTYDESSADAALAQHLAFWCGKNCERMFLLMWRSGLVRDKWTSNKNYLATTIKNACAMQTDVYTGTKKKIPLEEVQNTKPIDELLTEEKPFIPIDNLSIKAMPGFTGDHLTDATILLSTTFDNRLVNMEGVLHYSDGRKMVKIDDRTIRRGIGKAMGYGDVKVTQNRIRGTLDVLKDQAPEIGEANPQSRNVYFNNCVLNPETVELSHHKIINRNTSTLTVDYQSEVNCPQFDKFLNSIYINDPEQIRLLQEVIGWILICDYLGIEKAVLFIGPPRAGKGVIARIIFALLDSGAIPFSLSELDDNKRLSSMRYTRVAIDPDAVGPPSRNARCVTGLFKIITSNEKLSVPQLYAQVPWTGSLNCKLFVMANSIPTMWDDSTATGNRWIPVMFSQSFLGRENPNLYKTLVTELPGIAAWAVEGLKRLITRGYFELPQSSRDQLESLVSDGGSTQDFINDRLVLGESERVTDPIMWDVYRQWAISTGHEIGKRSHILKSLEDALRGHGVRRAKSIRMHDGKDYRGFYGVAVNSVAASGQVIPFPPS